MPFRPGWAVAAHAVVGLAMGTWPAFATAHVALAIVVALWWAVEGRTLERVAWAAGYIAVCDVLWRMTDARVFWEGAKYAVVLVLGVALFRFFRVWRGLALPAAYAACFLPAVVVALLSLGVSPSVGSVISGIGTLRSLISSNLSGPLALAVSVAFFAQVRSDPAALRRLLWVLALPCVAVATVAVSSTVGAGSDLSFAGQSNFATSGGFGPNQVSAVLGLGALCCLLLALDERQSSFRLLEVGLAVAFLAQAALTFSRGGIVNVVVALVLAGICLVRHVRAAADLVAVLVVLVLIGAWFVVPRLNDFTGGALAERYSDFDSTNRGELARSDLSTFAENPVAGVGVGLSAYERSEDLGFNAVRIAPHTELSRLLAEHGVLGVAAAALLATIAVRAWRRAAPGIPRAMVAAFVGWSLTEMGHSSMRLASISFVFALGVAAANMRPVAPPSVQSLTSGGSLHS